MTTILKEGNREVGRYNEEKKQFVSMRDKKTHFFYKGGGYPISEKVLIKLIKLGCDTICILEKQDDGSLKKYKAPIKNYAEGEVFEEKGFERQMCIPIRKMQLYDNDEPILRKENAKEIIFELLHKDKRCREDNLWLMLQVWKKQQIRVFIPFEQLQDMIPPSTITRCKRKYMRGK